MDSIKQISKRLKLDVQTYLPETKTLLRNSLSNVILESLSGVFYSLYKQLDIVDRDSNVLTCKNDRLDQFSQIWGINRLAPTKATATVEVTDLPYDDQSPTNELVLGEVFTDDSGVPYISTITTPITQDLVDPTKGFITSLLIEAEEAGATVKPIEIYHDTYIVNIDTSSYIIGNGTEHDDSLRIRILNRIQMAPAGGNVNDYYTWLGEIGNLGKTWVIPNIPEYGSVLIGFLDSNGGIPTPSHVTSVQSYIDDRRPISAKVVVGTPIPKIVDLTIKLNPDTPSLRSEVLSNLSDMFDEKVEHNTTFYKSWISEAIANSSGEISHELTLPESDIKLDLYEIAVLGTVTFA